MRHVKTLGDNPTGSWWRMLLLPKPIHNRDNYDGIFRLVAVGTLALCLVSFLLLSFSFFVLHHNYVFYRLLLTLGALLYMGSVFWLWDKGHKTFASQLLIYFYAFIAALIIITWGINVPFGILLLALTITLASILFGSRYTLWTAALAILILLSVQTTISFGWYTPEQSAFLKPSDFGDVLGYSALLTVLALLSWLFGRQTERAEAALLGEKELLESRVEERTKQLQEAQMQEMQNLYRFAEIGQLSTALIHDLANHLTVLTFDIADLDRSERSSALQHARHSIQQLEKTIAVVRVQLEGSAKPKHFTITNTIRESLRLLTHKAEVAHVRLTFKPLSKQLSCYHDPSRLGHIITILVTNAIDAYKHAASDKREILVEATSEPKTIIITVQDWGPGISKQARHELFEPFNSTKKTGMGIGLFIARQIAETHFKGTLTLDETADNTKFILKFPTKSS